MFYPTKMVAEPRRLGAAPKWKKACPLSFNFECGTMYDDDGAAHRGYKEAINEIN
jgi:hypothetical protein